MMTQSEGKLSEQHAADVIELHRDAVRAAKGGRTSSLQAAVHKQHSSGPKAQLRLASGIMTL